MYSCGVAVAAEATDPADRGFGGGFVETPLSQAWEREWGAPNIWDLAPVGPGFAGAIADMTTEQSVFGAVRYRRNGTLDRRFGKDGFTPPLKGLGEYATAQAQAIAVEPGGRIVVAGFWHSPGQPARPLLARYRSDGYLDRSFGHRGIVALRRRHHYRGDVLHDIAIAPGGRMVAVGASGEHGIGESSRYPADLVTAYRPDGQIDRRFGRNGRVTFPAPGGAEYTGLKSIRVLPDGRLLVAGFHYGSLFVARLLPDGRLDPSFGAGTGKVAMTVNPDRGGCSRICWSSAALSLREDGRIVILSANLPDVPVVVQLWPNGERDWSFGHAGVVKVRVKRHLFFPFGATLQRGRILLVGWDEARRGAATLTFCAFRYLADGKLDRGFGHGGVWLHRGAEFSGAFAALNQSHGRVVVAGGSEDKPKRSAPYESFLQLTRFLPR